MTPFETEINKDFIYFPCQAKIFTGVSHRCFQLSCCSEDFSSSLLRGMLMLWYNEGLPKLFANNYDYVLFCFV